jgi:[ribosomal protein S5]-alanine N-acetyltransferase
MNEKEYEVQTIETKRLILRKLSIKDKEHIFEYASQEIVSRYVPWEVHHSLEDTVEFLKLIEKKNEKKNRLTWGIVLKEENKLIGTIDLIRLDSIHKKAEFAYVLSNFYWGKGFMQEAAEALLDYGFNDLNLNKISAQIMLGNKQSERVIEKLGMTEEGILRQDFCYKGEFIDLKNFSILKEEYESMRRGAKV